MFVKRILSVIICIVLMTTLVVIPVSNAGAATTDTAQTQSNIEGYNLPSDVHNGNILHAFNWKLKEVTQYAQEIAAAGYTAVQVSPIQATKDTTNDGAYANDWWSFYQPLDLSIGNELGNASDLKTMCDTLHSYGIKVICDVVTNHVQNSTSKTEAAKVSETLRSYLRRGTGTTVTPYIDNTRAGQVTTDLNSQLPDLDTSNKDYQNYVISYLNSLADCGVDGFRFDAAKHIETPKDGSVASDFWPTITAAITAKKPNSFIYGEVLSLGGLGDITGYTDYIDVTDYAYGATVRSALKSKSASSLSDYGYVGSADKDNVLWVESHDTFTTATTDSSSSNTLTIAQQIVGWAVVGARKDAPALYLVRTSCTTLEQTDTLSIKYDAFIGAPGAAETWKSDAVVAVNQFKNEFVGQSETTYTNGNLFYVQRGTTGMVIANLNAASATVSQACSMKDGTYYDQVTGNKFTVSNGTLSGKVGSTGVAVVYNPEKAAPIATVKLNSTVLDSDSLNGYTDATATISVTLKNATGGTVKVSNLPAVDVPAQGKVITLNSSIDYGDGINITVTATNGSQTTTNTYKVYKKNANETKRVYFDNTVTQWPAVYVYCKTGESSSTQISAFPGYKMNLVSGSTNLYYYDVPTTTNYVKFNEGAVSAHIGHTVDVCGGYCGRTMPQTVILYGTANEAKNREAGGYQLTGSMIFDKLEWKDYGEYPVATLSSGDITYPDELPTEPSTQGPTYTPGTLILGDSDLDGDISILDATVIQRHIAKLATLSTDGLTCADVDNDGDVSIIDATYIQRYKAKLEAPDGIGEPIDSEVIPDDPVVVPSTVTVTLNATDCFEGGAVYLYAYNDAGGANGAWPGQPMNASGSGYTLDVDSSLDKIKFVGYYGATEDGLNTIETNVFTLTDTPFTLESIKITCSESWSSCYIHLWGGEGTSAVSTVWPGILMQGSSGNYYFNIPKDSAYEKYIINDGNGTQRNEVSINGTSGGNSGGNTDTITVYFTNNSNWSAVYAYAWDGANKNQEWPGEQMQLVENNMYSIEFPANTYTGIVFSNGSGDQTGDLTLTSEAAQYFTP